MLTANKRLTTGLTDRDEYIYAIAFYGVAALSVFLLIFTFANTDFLKNASLFWYVCIWLIGILSISIMITTSDFKDTKNLHKKTLEYFIADLNLSKRKIRKNDKFLYFSTLIQGLFTILAFTTYVKEQNFNIINLTLISYILFCLIVKLDGSQLLTKIVSAEKLYSFENLDDLNQAEKDCFVRSCQGVIAKNGAINRKEVRYISTVLLEYRNKRLEEERQQQIKSSYTEEYKEFMTQKEDK